MEVHDGFERTEAIIHREAEARHQVAEVRQRDWRDLRTFSKRVVRNSERKCTKHLSTRKKLFTRRQRPDARPSRCAGAHSAVFLVYFLMCAQEIQVEMKGGFERTEIVVHEEAKAGRQVAEVSRNA